MARSGTPRKRRSTRTIDPDATYRHHLEEASTHIRAAQVVLEEQDLSDKPEWFALSSIGSNLNKLHRHRGGVPHD